MQLGMIGLGRMGANIIRRVVSGGHEGVVYDHDQEAVKALAGEAGMTGAFSVAELKEKMTAPRVVWVMVPAGDITTSVIEELGKTLEPGDIVIDGGNSYYRDDLKHSKFLAEKGIHLMDCGTSGGVWGRERGYCLMIGGDQESFDHAEPLFATIAPGVDAAPRTPGREGEVTQPEKGYLHCGPAGAGHFVKMVHNGIEYGMMASLAEGLNILRNADIGTRVEKGDAETAPLSNPECYRYNIDIPDVAEVWRRGSVVGSWLLDLTAIALHESPDLHEFSGRVSDSGEGRWTAIAAIDEGVPAPVLTTALQSRFASRSLDDFANKALSAMRKQFGGHAEKPAN
ncbi:phosphogluconate dehydrogenase (NAD(+)-dependent, decarboxylating) [Mycobacterium montefiorense]|uniref:6-phosphogluconate dehydrogenase (Decarboxylating) n=1 Tax=Mycobacterium montefiorense TaxID=154654 RepID=A0AA37V135_9MYCO|nr:decarboxylating 6-phosphogluconate dehydrogenase [Mycobacterium montefiorense]GBG39439.1 6-phosphogluconate dehydrogenase (decarboxylating) [Mycobacterium montefiorense]GKU36023.1 6-phosphogluconate dehydrogenase (decarboxylating) [Mycobacterium montefiorense]GKU41092.1 6-phosphogluconate dehydrogenase (decarboxylating) [Mycobacterium montefiorense]GKU44148.1 6-phosphogluconate dehydrogenase (decarboxylating) [Mycobacterium montefiorense]GKU52438.1 6-phosphogluconate dehydrogenase (decarbox